MRGLEDICGCFPTGRHYPGLAERIAATVVVVQGLANEWQATDSWQAGSLVSIDFETTGFDSETARIIEVGLACIDAGQITLTRNWLINPGMPIPQEARDITGITDEQVKDAPTFAQAFEEIHEVLRGRLPIAYNAEFDRRFLHAEAKRVATFDPESCAPALRQGVSWVDPLVWTRELHKHEKSRRLADVCERLGIPLEQAHRAAHDAEAAGKVLLVLSAQMPRTYGELIRLQAQYAARQDVDTAMQWRSRRPSAAPPARSSS